MLVSARHPRLLTQNVFYRRQGPDGPSAEGEEQGAVDREEEEDLRAVDAQIEAVVVSRSTGLPDRVILPDVQAEHRQARQKCVRVVQEKIGI